MLLLYFLKSLTERGRLIRPLSLLPSMFHHQIKLCDPHYRLIESGVRNYQICFDDQLFKVNQTMRILEFKWDTAHNIKTLTGEYFEREISNVLKKGPGLNRAYVIVSFK